MLDNFRADIRRYYRDGDTWRTRLYLFFEQGLWALAVYRFGRWAGRVRILVVGHVLRWIAFFLFKLAEILTGISLPASAEIGPGFYVGHFGGIVLHSEAKVGANCAIGPGVLIGTRGQGHKGVPQLGDGVYVGVGAKILGGITIGNNARIGANAVVLRNVPDNATAVGIPARVIRQEEA